MTASIVSQVFRSERFPQFVKFCLVGGSGLFVDMGVLFLLADPRCLGLNVTVSKICSAEAALTSNFILNEFWTFRPALTPQRFNGSTRTKSGVFQRFLLFNAICGIGIWLAVILLHVIHTKLGLNLYLSNLLAILLITLWNFGLNVTFNWRVRT